VICGAHQNDGTAFDLLKFVKSDQNRRTIPFLIFSFNPTDLAKSVDESVRTTARLLGADKYSHFAVSPCSYQDLVELTIFTTDSITGTSISTPTTVASAAPELKPNRLIAVATASSKKLLAPIKADGQATQ
jgi:hypothetical protein